MTKEQKLLQLYEEKMQRIAESTASGAPAFESNKDKEKRKARLLKDYDAFKRYYFADYCTSPSGQHHKKLIGSLKRSWCKVHLIQWPRGYGKSLEANLFYPVRQLVAGQLKGFIGYSANQDLAMRLLMDLKANLESNQRLIHDWGKFKGGKWEMHQFITKGGIGFYAFGVDQTVRGTRFGHRRPNIASIDDLNDMRTLKNDQLSREKYERVKEDLLPALDANNWQALIPQNKFHTNAVTALFEADQEIKKKVALHRVNLLDAKGKSTWPEHISTAKAKDKIASLGYLSSQREYFNNPIIEGQVFKREYIQWTKRLQWNKYDLLLSYSDPSYKNTHKSDYKATILIGKTKREYHILRAKVAKTSSVNMFEWCYGFDEEVGDHSLIQHWMEAGFIQDMHFEKLQGLEDRHGRRLRIRADNRKKPDKYQRVTSLEPLFISGRIKLDKTQQEDPGMLKLINQLLAFEKGSNINDDGPDALEGGVYKIDEQIRVNVKPVFIGRTKKSKFSF